MKKSPTRNRFTEEQQRAAVRDMAEGMTLAKAAEKYGCSQSALSLWKNKFKSTNRRGKAAKTVAGAAPKATALHDEQRFSDLEEENRRLRRLLLNGYISSEPHPKLKRIAQIIRDNNWNQLERIMEALLENALKEAVRGGAEVVIAETAEQEPEADIEGATVATPPPFRIRRKGKFVK
jgi:transposase-like protein